jgi:hypothetical protein
MSRLERLLTTLTVVGVVFSAGAVIACGECRTLLLSHCKEAIIRHLVSPPASQPL